MRRCLVATAIFAVGALALGEPKVIVFPSIDTASSFDDSSQITFSSSTSSSSTDDFLIASNHQHHAAALLLDSADDEAIHIAARTFAHDIYRVTGVSPSLYNDSLPHDVKTAIVAGSASSKLISGLHGTDYADDLKGKWESYDVREVKEPGHGLEDSLVVVGSDRRGTIYALYTLSEQMGVSPFHFWSDVPVRSRPAIAFSHGKKLSHGEPTVKYRGVFINDEHPALWSWAAQKWKVKWGEPALLTDMYAPWFEMMLRLKANYFWPAMYASMFDVDGMDTYPGFPEQPLPGPNQVLANAMGVVMGTSHHEPMARNKPEWDRGQQGPWDWTNKDFLTEWWTYGAERAKGKETLFTLGMRGDGDMPLTGASNKLVENITATQQGILRDVYDTDDLSSVPQMWCMYKEVAEYFINGLEVPEDVSILFADDNWGNIMSVLPPGKEHKAGAGIYYHVDYVGMPRAYKWINTINLAKTWDQMSIARAFNTTAIWIVNVGTLKPLELPTEHFLSLAWDLDAWPINSVDTFLSQWASREFGEEVSEEVADIMSKYSMYASRRKAELVNSTTWSLTNYEEAERVLGEWEDLSERAGKVYEGLDEDTKPAFYELVYMLVLGQVNLNKLYIAAERSVLYAQQGRNAANVYARQAVDAFFEDEEITEKFHSLLDRKWDHMWDQTHINWNSWLEPVKDIMPPISFVKPNQPAREGIPIPELGYGVISNIRVTHENSQGSWPGNTAFNCPRGEHCGLASLLPMDPYGAKSRWIDVGAAGPRSVKFKVESDKWIKVHPSHGHITKDASHDVRLRVSIDWDNVPENEGKEEVTGQFFLHATDGSNVTIEVPVRKYAVDKGFTGFVQGDGYVAIEAGHLVRNQSKGEYAFQEMKGYGRTRSGVEMFPMTTQNFTVGEGPSIEYDFWTHPIDAESESDSDSESGSELQSSSSSDSDSDDVEAEVTIQIGPTLNFLGVNKTIAFAFQLDDSSPTIINPVPTEPLGFASDRPENKPVAIGAVPKDWIDIVKNEIRDVRIPVKLSKSGGKHSIKIYGMTTGIVLERVLVDLGGIKSRGYSYLGPPESAHVTAK